MQLLGRATSAYIQMTSRSCIFQQDGVKPQTASITTAWLLSRRVQALDWPACCTDLWSSEKFWSVMKNKTPQRSPRTVEQLESYIRQEWDKVHLAKVQQLVSSVPRCLQTVLKEEGMLHIGKHGPVPTFFFSRLALLSMAKKYVSLSTSDVVNKFFEALWT